MPNLKQSKAKLDEYVKAEKQLKGGNSIIVDGVELKPSIDSGSSDSDLSSVKRMIARLEKQVERAKLQSMRKGITSENGDVVGFAMGVPKLADDLKLNEDDLKSIIPTGQDGKVSRRDIRVYANAKASGTLERYIARNETRRTGKSPQIEKVKEVVKGSLKPESKTKDLTLSNMKKGDLVAKCKELGLKSTGITPTLRKRIKDHLAKAEESAPKPEPVQKPESTVNPLA